MAEQASLVEKLAGSLDLSDPWAGWAEATPTTRRWRALTS